MKRTKPLMAMPPGIKPRDFDWEPLPKVKYRRPRLTEAELLKRKAQNRLAMVLKWKAKWDQEELEYLKRRAKALETSVAADKEWLRIEAEREERQAEWDKQLTAIQNTTGVSVKRRLTMMTNADVKRQLHYSPKSTHPLVRANASNSRDVAQSEADEIAEEEAEAKKLADKFEQWQGGWGD